MRSTYSPPAPPRSPARAPRGWLWLVLAAVAAAQAAKFPAMRTFLDENLHQGPDTSEMSPELVDAALSGGAVLGLVVSMLIGALLVTLVHRQAPRLTRADPPAHAKLPYWLAGITLVGLVVPDLVSAVTGTIFVTSSVPFYVIYLPLAVAAVLLSPPPRDRRLRVADLVLLAVLPFV